MMDQEIDLPVYLATFTRLAARIADLPGPVVDTSCGSGHMLWRYRERFEPTRALVGLDLSPKMVSITKERLGGGAEVRVGDMRQLKGVESGSAAAILSFFAIHHLGPEDGAAALIEWSRALCPGGVLMLAAWEGEGVIDYGEMSDVVAFRYLQKDLKAWAEEAGFRVDDCRVEPVEDFPMDAVYLEATKL